MSQPDAFAPCSDETQWKQSDQRRTHRKCVATPRRRRAIRMVAGVKAAQHTVPMWKGWKRRERWHKISRTNSVYREAPLSASHRQHETWKKCWALNLFMLIGETNSCCNIAHFSWLRSRERSEMWWTSRLTFAAVKYTYSTKSKVDACSRWLVAPIHVKFYLYLGKCHAKNRYRKSMLCVMTSFPSPPTRKSSSSSVFQAEYTLEQQHEIPIKCARKEATCPRRFKKR